jgi:MFS family permease
MRTLLVRPHGMIALWGACVLGGAANSLSGTAGTLLADHAGGTPAVAGLPQAVGVAGAAAAAVLISRVTLARGRGVALAAGAGASALACVVTFAGAIGDDLLWVLLGSALLGAGNATVMLGRYAAADLVPDGARIRAMGSVLAVSTIGAVAGPNLLPLTGSVPGAGGSALAGAYLVAAAAFVLAALALGTGLPRARTVLVAPPSRSTPASSRAPIAALVVLGTSNLIMVGGATMAPVHLGHHDVPLAVIGLLVGVHVGAMFAPSALSARLVELIGARPAAGLAGVAYLAAGAVATSGDSAATMLVAVVALGLGWNLALVSGSTLLTEGRSAAERPVWEGRGEAVTGIAAVVGSAGSGLLMTAGGYTAVAVAAMVCSLALLVPPARAAATRFRRAADARPAPATPDEPLRGAAGPAGPPRAAHPR